MSKAIARCAVLLIGAALLCTSVSAVMGANLLLNPGFDAGAFTQAGSGGATSVKLDWTCYFPSTTGTYVWQEADRAVPHMIGPNAVHHSTSTPLETPGGDGETHMYQDVWVVPNSQYTASVKIWGVSGIHQDYPSVGFGSTATDRAALHVVEYDVNGNISVDHAKLELATATTDWVTKSETFTTHANTVKIRFRLESKIGCNWQQGRAVYEDAVLDGPAGTVPTATISGTVSAGGSPVQDASVKIGGTTVTTGVGGAYSIPGVSADAEAKITASYAGYYSEHKYRTPPAGATTVNFDLVALPASNLLANPGFETWPNVKWGENEASQTQSESGWSLWFPTAGMYATHELEGVRAPGYPHGGSDAACHGGSGSNGECYMWQEIPVIPGTPYHAGALIKGHAGFTATDTASLWVQEINDDGTVVVYDHGEMPIVGPTQDYVFKDVSFTAQASTAKVRFILHSRIAANWTVARAIYDDCFLEGAVPTATVKGTVTSGGSPLQGVTITWGETTATTGADGKYQFEPVALTPAEQKFTASKDGYISENKYRVLATGENILNFDLVLVPQSQLLANWSFDTWPNTLGANSGQSLNNAWWCKWYGPAWSYFAHEKEAVRAPGYQHSGFDAVCMASESGGAHLAMWQDIDVVAGQPYTASVWVKGQGTFGAEAGSPDSAGMWIIELGAGGATVLDHGKIELTDPTEDFVLQKLQFTPNAATKKVRFLLDTVISDTWPVERAIFDDAILDGPAPPTFLTGTVTSGGVPVEGALVEVLNRGPNDFGGAVLASDVTDASGVYRIDDEPTGSLVTVRASKSTHYAQGLGRTLAKGESTVNFDLVARGSNLLDNTGFDDVWSASWGTYAPGNTAVQPETVSATYGPVAYKSGEQAITIASGGGNGEASAYQLVGVQPSSQYTAKTWFRAATNSTATVWGNTTDYQKAGLLVTEFSANGTTLVSHPLVAATETLEQWEQLSYPFTTSPTTAFVSVAVYAYMVDNYYATLARAVFEDVELNGLPAGTPLDIAAVKALGEGQVAYVKDQVVSAQFPSHFYIESADRASGIRVAGAGVAAGRLATIVGTVQVVDGEKTLVPNQLQTVPGGVRPVPFELRNRAAFTPPGLSPVGLYVWAWGKVDATGGNVFTITDGSWDAIKVYGPAGFEAVPNSYVRVRGAVGSELDGENTVPVLRALQVVQEQ